MAFKVYVPTRESAAWGDYWSQTTISDNLKNCETDGLLPILEKYLPKKGKIVEAGCGLGKWVIFLKNKGYAILGTDSYKGAIDLLKKFDKNLPVRVDDVSDSKLKSASFDAYLSFGVVEHFESGPQKPLAESFRILKKGGIAIIETPYDNLFRQIVRFVVSLKKPVRLVFEALKLRSKRLIPEEVFYEYHYTRDELINFVKSAGYTILETFPKDDLSYERSIGLWLDFPKLRKVGGPNFFLNSKGIKIKKLLSHWPNLWSACIVVVAQKD